MTTFKHILIALGLSVSCSMVCAQSTATPKPKPQIKEKPTIVALAPHIVEMLYAIGAGNQIVGTTDYSDYPESAKKIPRIANHARLQIERFVEIKPDIVISWKSGNPSDDIAKLRSLGFKVVYSQPDTLMEVAKELLEFGKLTGNEAKAKQVAAQYVEKLNALRTKYKNKRKVSVFYEAWSNPLSTIAKGAWPQLHLDICGATNPFYQAANAYPNVSIEQILKHNIELIITPRSGYQKERKNDNSGYNWTRWKLLKAVKHQQLTSPNADLLHRMTPRVLDEVTNLCEAIDQSRQFYLNKT